MPVNRSVPDVAQKRKDWNDLISGFKASDQVSSAHFFRVAMS